MVYKANDYKNMCERREKEIHCDCRKERFWDGVEWLVIGLLGGFGAVMVYIRW